MTWYHAVCFPVMGSIMLLVFFYFFEYIQYVYTVLTAGEIEGGKEREMGIEGSGKRGRDMSYYFSFQLFPQWRCLILFSLLSSGVRSA